MDPFDLTALAAHRAVLEGLDPDGSPSLALLDAEPGDARAVALLPGSFNPPTAAHVLLAERALSEGFDRVVFVLAAQTVGKEQGGLIPEDRLLALGDLTGPSCSLGVCSHGLYADQAAAAAAAFPGADVAFLVGSDKVLQIFDGEWYEDRERALGRLFDRARLVCAPRGDQAERLRSVLEAPENAPWARAVAVLRLHPAVVDLSSTHVRGLLRAGADPTGLVPPSVAAFLARVRAFAPPVTVGADEVDAYEVRVRLFDLIWRLDGGVPDAFDLSAPVGIALADSAEGRRLREALRAGDEVASDAVRALAR